MSYGYSERPRRDPLDPVEPRRGVEDAFELEESIETTSPAASQQLGSAESVRVLLEHRGRLVAAAAALGVSPRTLQRRLRARGLSARTLRRELSLAVRP